MKKGKAAILTGTFLVVALLLLGGFNLSKPRILVLHSSDRNSSTAKKMDEAYSGFWTKTGNLSRCAGITWA